MIRFFSKSLFLILLVVSTYVVLYILPERHVSYLSASLDKHNRLDKTPAPRVIFVGGSNLAFGLNSEMVEQRTGYPPVNMGLAAGLGLRFMLGEVKPALSPGDVVVLVPEYQQFDSSLNGERDLAELIAIAPHNLRYLSSLRQYFVVVRNSPLYFQDKVYRWLTKAVHGFPATSEIYRRDGFNMYGDLTTHLGRPPKTDWLAEYTRGPFKPIITDEAIAVLNDFEDYAESKGAHVVFIFPSIPDLPRAEKQQSADAIYQRLKVETKLNIAGPPKNYFLPVSCFFDTEYHLVRDCRESRTRQILTDLDHAGFAKTPGTIGER